MNIAAAIVVLLSHAGFWVGGAEQRIELTWAVPSGMPAATVDWDLSIAGAPLANGTTTLPADDGRVTVKIVAPAVRAAVDAVWRYRVTADGGREMARGEKVVHLFPNELGQLQDLTRASPLLVIDQEAKLPSVLTAAGASFERADSVSAAVTATQPIVIVGEGRLAADDPAAGALTALAEGGTSVIVLRQAGAADVLQFHVVRRDTAGYTTEAGHPLLRHLLPSAWESLSAEANAPALAVPAEEAALELIHSPIESPGVKAAPLDVLLLSRTTGRGRIVFCQLPVNDAKADARQQRLLLNLIEYARTRSQPTPPRSQRYTGTKTDSTRSSGNLIPEGGKQ